MNQKSDSCLLQVAPQNASNCKLGKSFSRAVTKWTLSCPLRPCTHRPPPRLLLPSLSLIRGKHLTFCIFHCTPGKWYKCSGTFLLPCHQVCLLGLAAIRIRGTQLKSFHCGSPPPACAWGLEVQDVLCVGFSLWSPLLSALHQLHHQQCLQLMASLYQQSPWCPWMKLTRGTEKTMQGLFYEHR